MRGNVQGSVRVHGSSTQSLIKAYVASLCVLSACVPQVVAPEVRSDHPSWASTAAITREQRLQVGIAVLSGEAAATGVQDDFWQETDCPTMRVLAEDGLDKHLEGQDVRF